MSEALMMPKPSVFIYRHADSLDLGGAPGVPTDTVLEAAEVRNPTLNRTSGCCRSDAAGLQGWAKVRFPGSENMR